MKAVEARLLRGPNIHAREPRFVVLLEAEAGEDAAHAADKVLSLLVVMQRRAGHDVAEGTVSEVRNRPEQRRIACGFRSEAVVERAFRSALHLVPTHAAASPDDVETEIRALRTLIAGQALDATTEALLAAARSRGIPVLRPDDGEARFQLGWGHRGRRFVAGVETPSMDSLFAPGDDGRIPVIAITGTNGKTTTTQLIAYALSQTQRRVGVTTTQGIFIDGQQVDSGDCTGYWSARTVLESMAVDVAVLETARGGILKRGLAFDACDVAVVLNVSGDHLGLDGVETIGELAHVKGVVARSATRAAVLAADDAYCVAMAASLQRGCAPVWFAMTPNHSLIESARVAGGRAAWLDESGWIVWRDGSDEHRLMEASHMPFALGGHARYNVANALAATAALGCIGERPEAIAAALATFVSDAKRNPLRSNRFEAGGVTIILDYAHNVAAYRALCAMARSLADERGGRVIGVVTSPGDRRAADLFDIGQACGEGFDDLIVYEQDPRGRHAGETTRAILAGARAAGADKRLEGVPRIREAIASGLRLARERDLLVFTCAGTLEDFVAGVSSVDPAAGRHISVQIFGNDAALAGNSIEPSPGLSMQVNP